MLKSNEYFGGKVKSIALTTEDGPATVGVISAGEFEFSTTSFEYMTVLNGSLDVLFPEQDEWVTVEDLETFAVPPNVSFKVKADGETAYMCLYSDQALTEFSEDDESCGCTCSCNT